VPLSTPVQKLICALRHTWIQLAFATVSQLQKLRIVTI
jgi:hypothetical protein